MSALFNEWEAYPAAWLRNLITAGHIAPGSVDERSIRDLRATDIRGATQFHAFAGLGGWSHALRLAGWPDDREVWTASCPCQPFSDAGRGRGVDDERHLWPVVAELVRECRPAIIFGEQVASRAGLEWFSAVRADLEGAGYAVGAADLCAAGVGAPHIRQRIYFVGVRLADGDGNGRSVERSGRILDVIGSAFWHDADRCSTDDRMADGNRAGLEGRPVDGRDGGSGGTAVERGGGRDGRMADSEEVGRGPWRDGRSGGQWEVESRGHGASGRMAAAVRAGRSERWPVAGDGPAAGCGVDGWMGNADREHSGRDSRGARRTEAEGERGGARDGCDGDEPRASGRACAWVDAEYIACSDGKARPAQPGVHPLAHGVPGRVGQLRAYGNAIVPQVAAAFISAVTPWIDAVQARAA